MEEEVHIFSKEDEKLLRQFVNSTFRTLDIIKVYAKRNKELLDKNYDRVGKIISCHLLIENLIGTWLLENGHCDEKFLKRAMFWKKLERMKGNAPPMFIKGLIPALGQINDLRNSLTHDINFDLETAEIGKINSVLQLKLECPTREYSIEEKVEQITSMCIFGFTLGSKDMKRSWAPFNKNNPDFFDFSGKSQKFNFAWSKLS